MRLTGQHYLLRKQTSHLKLNKALNSLPQNKHQGLKEEQSIRHCTQLICMQQTTYQYRLLPILNPPKSSKVGRFSTVKSMIEASVITIRKGYHELPSFLRHLEGN